MNTSNWNWTLSPIKGQKQLVRILILLTLACYGVSFAFPLALQQTIDAVINKNTTNFLWLFSLSVVLSALEIALSNERLKTIITLSARAELKTQGKFLRAVFSLQYNQKLYSPGELLNAIKQVKSANDFALQTAPQVVLDLGQILISFAIIAYFNTPISAILAAILLTGTLFMNRHSSSLSNQTQEHFQAESRKQGTLSNIAFSLRSIKSNAIESYLYKRFLHQNKLALATYSKALDSSRSIQLWGTTTARTLTIFLIVYGGHSISNGNLTLGEFITIQILISRMISPLAGIGEVMKKYHETNTALTHITRLINLPQEPLFKRTADDVITENDFMLPKLSFSHTHEKCILKNVSIQLPHTGLIVLAGANGSGKSTLAYSLLGISGEPSGEILYHNKKITPVELRSKISFMEQDSYIFPGSIRENLSCGEIHSDYERYQAVTSVGLDEFIYSLPDKLDHQLLGNGKNLSGGQKQKLCLARALLCENSFYILDEPTSAMDGNSSAKIADLIIGLKRNCLVICITHAPLIMQEAHSILFMSEGTVIASGRHKELIDSCMAYRNMYFPKGIMK
ncbi:peptidase domain-containing ABC transporter [Pseudomonas sp. ABY48]|uniref:peptidase domain-containing ABC transporter n=1 Tax=Pseudomonas sp. ABY48 TaxID=3402865 RepID=UPI003B438985